VGSARFWDMVVVKKSKIVAKSLAHRYSFLT
jgi:hypothetical protein